ncbi:MAG TPA: succinylglutamate desuccinylase/aspartoacylase family protein, partial [Arenibaculum sp.]|nr:succinylglutamate desuccinylase/aspartoacylase family protein [Arenibaculum sp.]
MSGTLHGIELTPPDIEPYRRGNTGVDYVTTWTGPGPGPHVVVNALIHGNEPCGAAALDLLLRLGVRPTRGRLTFAFANVAAYRTFDRASPTLARFLDEDMNRLWDPAVLDGARRSIELDRARALRPVYESADYLLDLHSRQDSGEPLTLCGMTVRGRALACAIGYPRWIVADAGHAGGRRLLDHPRFSAPDPAPPVTLPAALPAALLVECGGHRDAKSARVATEVALRFLRHLDMIDPGIVAPFLGTGPSAP